MASSLSNICIDKLLEILTYDKRQELYDKIINMIYHVKVQDEEWYLMGTYEKVELAVSRDKRYRSKLRSIRYDSSSELNKLKIFDLFGNCVICDSLKCYHVNMTDINQLSDEEILITLKHKLCTWNSMYRIRKINVEY